MSEPKCLEVDCGSSWGASIQLVKYENTVKFNLYMGRKYSVPEDWTEEQIKEFQVNKQEELRGLIEPLAQTEIDQLEVMKEELN